MNENKINNFFNFKLSIGIYNLENSLLNDYDEIYGQNMSISKVKITKAGIYATKYIRNLIWQLFFSLSTFL